MNKCFNCFDECPNATKPLRNALLRNVAIQHNVRVNECCNATKPLKNVPWMNVTMQYNP